MKVLMNLKGAIELRFGTQRAFAIAAGVHHVRVNRLVKGWETPTMQECAKFSELLAASPDFLFKEFTIPAVRPSDNSSVES